VAGGSGHRRRRAARRTAVDLLYQADVMDRTPEAVMDQWTAAGRSIPSYSRELVEGVSADRAEIDRLLGAHAEGWTVQRMAVVDRTILRVACEELRSGLPAPIVVSEAVVLANELSTEDSGRFVNGVLGRIARDAEGVTSG
jgi:N utilization substance protein B